MRECVVVNGATLLAGLETLTQDSPYVAEIRGSEKPDEWILIGAHFDSWDFGTGAEDNGTGSVSVLEVARAIAALGKPPKRSIRFALWGGEEQGILGSYAYVQAHLNEMSKCVAVLNTDNGPGHPKGWKVEGRKDLKATLQPISDAVLKDLGAGEISMEFTYDTDHGPFVLQGVPALDQLVDDMARGHSGAKLVERFGNSRPLLFGFAFKLLDVAHGPTSIVASPSKHLAGFDEWFCSAPDVEPSAG